MAKKSVYNYVIWLVFWEQTNLLSHGIIDDLWNCCLSGCCLRVTVPQVIPDTKGLYVFDSSQNTHEKIILLPDNCYILKFPTKYVIPLPTYLQINIIVYCCLVQSGLAECLKEVPNSVKKTTFICILFCHETWNISCLSGGTRNPQKQLEYINI